MFTVHALEGLSGKYVNYCPHALQHSVLSLWHCGGGLWNLRGMSLGVGLSLKFVGISLLVWLSASWSAVAGKAHCAIPGTTMLSYQAELKIP